jgi:hypothetical protein
MKCQDFLPELETGGPWRRRRALRHAARCPRCAKVHAALVAVKATLAHPAPLSNHARELWNRAPRETAVLPERQIRLTPMIACLATAACVLIVFVGPVLWVNHDSSVTWIPGGSQEKTVVSATTVMTVDPVEEFSQLADAVDQLDAELQSLRLTAQRLEAQREVMVALSQYGKW